MSPFLDKSCKISQEIGVWDLAPSCWNQKSSKLLRVVICDSIGQKLPRHHSLQKNDQIPAEALTTPNFSGAWMLIDQPDSFLCSANPVALMFKTYIQIVFWSLGLKEQYWAQTVVCTKCSLCHRFTVLKNCSITYLHCPPDQDIVLSNKHMSEQILHSSSPITNAAPCNSTYMYLEVWRN